MFESANVQHRFFALERTLVENDAVADDFLQFGCEFLVEASLHLPDALELI